MGMVVPISDPAASLRAGITPQTLSADSMCQRTGAESVRIRGNKTIPLRQIQTPGHPTSIVHDNPKPMDDLSEPPLRSSAPTCLTWIRGKGEVAA